jgi:hypothetical protein
MRERRRTENNPNDGNGDASSEKSENTESGSLLGRNKIRVRAPMKEHNKGNEEGDEKGTKGVTREDNQEGKSQLSSCCRRCRMG